MGVGGVNVFFFIFQHFLLAINNSKVHHNIEASGTYETRLGDNETIVAMNVGYLFILQKRGLIHLQKVVIKHIKPTVHGKLHTHTHQESISKIAISAAILGMKSLLFWCLATT